MILPIAHLHSLAVGNFVRMILLKSFRVRSCFTAELAEETLGD